MGTEEPPNPGQDENIPMDFVAVDVETANRAPRSICQIGIASFRGGRLASLWGSLIDPEDAFSPFNIGVHGIQAGHVAGSPSWSEIQGELRPRLAQRLLASHTYFDLRAIVGANARYGVAGIPWAGWVDTCKIARIAWPSLPTYRLPHLAQAFGISYQAHDAMEDARCAGEILHRAIESSGLGQADLLRPRGRAVPRWGAAKQNG